MSDSNPSNVDAIAEAVEARLAPRLDAMDRSMASLRHDVGALQDGQRILAADIAKVAEAVAGNARAIQTLGQAVDRLERNHGQTADLMRTLAAHLGAEVPAWSRSASWRRWPWRSPSRDARTPPRRRRHPRTAAGQAGTTRAGAGRAGHPAFTTRPDSVSMLALPGHRIVSLPSADGGEGDLVYALEPAPPGDLVLVLNTPSGRGRGAVRLTDIPRPPSPASIR